MRIFLKLLVFLTMLCAACYAQNKKAPTSGYATIKIDAINFNPKDTLMLMYFTDRLYNVADDGDYKLIKKAKDSTGQYVFHFPVTNQSGGYFLARVIRPEEPVFKKKSVRSIVISPTLTPEIGDDIQMSTIQKDNGNGGFYYSNFYTGKGAVKCTVKEILVNMDFGLNGNWTEAFDKNLHYQPNNFLEDKIKGQSQFLKAKENEMSPSAYNLMVAESIYRNGADLSSLAWQLQRALSTTSNLDKAKLKENAKATLEKLYAINEFQKIDDDTKLQSYYYPFYVLTKIGVSGGPILGIDNKQAYRFLKKNYSGILRDKLLYYYFHNSDYINPDMSMLDDALKTIQTPYYLEKLKLLKNTNYQFELPDTNGKIVKQADLKGKVLVMDFWFTGCGACSGFYESVLSHVEPLFANNDSIKFISISIDRDKDRWKKSVASNKYTSSLATNLHTNGQYKDHPVIKYNNVIGYPTIIIQDRNGNKKTYNYGDLWDQKYFKQLLDDLVKGN